jgi:hypothetical protein
MKKMFVSYVTEKDTHSSDAESFPGVPRWVKVLAIMALVLLLVFAFFRFTGIVGDLSSAGNTYLLASAFLLSEAQGGQRL